MSHRYWIVTGTSRGIGAALAKLLLGPDSEVICIARSENEDLRLVANDEGFRYRFFRFDLNELDRIGDLMDRVFETIVPERTSSIALINNAAVVTPIGPIQLCADDELVGHYNTNVIAPALLTKHFISRVAEWKSDKQVLNVSSGCAETPFAGMSSYCSSKAGLNMFTECVNMEQQNAAYPVRLLVVYPGMIDTGMQSVARNSKADQLPTAHFFQQAYDEGVLATPEQTAEGIIRLLERGRQDACIVKQLN